MQQQTLDLLIHLNQPLITLVEFYDSNPAIQETCTLSNLLKLIETKREFFGDSVVNLPGSIFIRESFPGRLNEWFDLQNPNNLPKAV